MAGLTVDKYGSIGQIQPDGSIDGGDSVNWEGHRRYLTEGKHDYRYHYHKSRLPEYKAFFKDKTIGYKRHPRSSATASYYKNPWNGNISRDQLTGILAYHIKYTDYKESLKIILHHGAWLWLFAYNTVRNGDTTFKWKWPDFTGPDIWAMELRCLRPYSYLLYPIICMLDLHTLLNTLYFNRFVKDDDVISFAIKVISTREYMPTPFSWLAWKLLNKKKLVGLISDYWCGWRKNCGMADLYEKKIREFG